MQDPTGRIFNIQKFSIHDGPGIRTVVFLKGCPLACRWCSNPNSRLLRPVPMRDATESERVADDSRETTVDEVVHTCLQDLPFYEESGGGVTLSGGEPLVQHAFAIALLKRLRAEGIHTAIETTGHVAPHIAANALHHCDLVIMDVKHHDAAQHRRWTGANNALPLTTLEAALTAGVETWVRIPVIPGVNDTLADAESFATVLRARGVARVQLLPFHQYGERKYELLGWDYPFAGIPTSHPEDVEPFRRELECHGVTASFEAPA